MRNCYTKKPADLGAWTVVTFKELINSAVGRDWCARWPTLGCKLHRQPQSQS